MICYNSNNVYFKAVTQAKLNLSEKKDLNIMEDAEGDVDMVLEEEGAKIEEKERIAKEELEKELRQYRIKVRIKYYPKGRGRLFIQNLHFCVSVRDFPFLSTLARIEKVERDYDKETAKIYVQIN